MVSEWLGSWTPEHIVGLLTAAGVIITAIVVKGRYKSATSQSSNSEMVSSIRLHPLDLLLLEQITKDSHDLINLIHEIDKKIGLVQTDTAVLRDRKIN